MNCTTCKSELPDLLLDPGADAASRERLQLRAHLDACAACRAEFAALQRTFDLLDDWTAPEPSPYFDQKLAVLLREEQAKPAAGWLERMQARLLFNTGRQFRPMLAGALALAVVVGGGTFAGIATFSRPASIASSATASATVDDLQILDRNAQAIQQMTQLLQDDDGSDNTPDQPTS
jgi:anti-sigma factor RsiW